MDSLFVVMPAYNEETNIEKTVRDWYSMLSRQIDADWRIVIADSGSKDRTHEILVSMQEDHPRLSILSDTRKEHGPKLLALYSHAVKEGATFIFQTDSDGQTNPMEFPAFWEKRNQYDALIGVRSERGDGKERAFVEKVVCTLLRMYFGVKVPDANAPFRLMRTDLAAKYLDRMKEDYDLPNIMLTTFFSYYHENIQFCEVSFAPRTSGTNSVNRKKIIETGIKALSDFGEFRQNMQRPGGKRVSLTEKAVILIIFAILSFFFLLNSPLHPWIHGEAPMDSSVFQTVAMVMSHGGMPYLDTFDHKGPLIYLLNLIGRLIHPYQGVWAVEFVFLLSLFFTMYLIARLLCGRICSFFCTLAAASLLFPFFEGGNYTEEYALLPIALSLYFFLKYLQENRITRLEIALCGIGFAAVFWLRMNMAAVWIVFCFAILFRCLYRKEWRMTGRFVLYFFLGFFVLTGPILIWLSMKGALSACWQDYILFNMSYIDTFADKAAAFRHFLGSSGLILFSLIACVILAVLKNHFLYGVYAGYLVATLLLVSLSGRTSGHHGMILVPALVFPLAAVLSLCGGRGIRNGRVWLCLLLAAQFLVFDWTGLFTQAGRSFSERNEEKLPVSLQEACEVIRQFTDPEDRITVFGNHDVIYLLSDRLPATLYSYQIPIGNVEPEIMKDYYRQLSEEPPKLIVLSREGDGTAMLQFAEEHDYELLWAENAANPPEGLMILSQ